MTRKLSINLTKKQGELLESFNDPETIEILFGGGARGGKTWGIAEIINMTCIAYPGIAWIVGRREWDDLLKSTLETITKVLTSHGLKKDVDYNLNLQTKVLRYYNGSRIFFVPLKQQPTDPEFNFLGGYEVTHAFVDEAQEVSRKAIDVLKSRLTEKIKEYGIVGKVLMGCNPDKGHLYKDFIKPHSQGTLIRGRAFIQSLYKDNPHIDHAKYEESLKDANKVTRERLLYGNWEYDDTPGRLFEYEKLLDMRTNPKRNGQKYISCDAARKGKDKAVIRVWDGFEEIDKVVYDRCLNTDIENKIRELAQRHGIGMSNVVVDEDGVGGGIVDSLECRGFVNNSSPLSPYGARSNEYLKRNFANLKTQCYFELAKLVNQNMVRVLDDSTFDMLVSELDIVVQVDIDKDSKIRIISKEDVKDKIGRSPDFADSLMMRAYFELLKDPETEGEYRQVSPVDGAYATDIVDEWERMEKEMRNDRFDVDDVRIFDEKLDSMEI